MRNQKIVLILSSPTASGKSKVALRVAETIPIEIISADSRQIFKYLTIGTAKPTRDEMAAVPHHFTDELEPGTPWNAGKFVLEARKRIKQVFDRGRIPCIVGGTGLYIKALIDGIVDLPEADSALRRSITIRFEQEGLAPLVDEFRRVDPIGSEIIDIKNPRRVIRALEIYYMTGMTRKEIQTKSEDPLLYPVLWFGLHWNRDALYKRINERVDRMMELGLIDEVRSILAMGYAKHINALQSVGYAETIDYLEGKYSGEELIQQIKQNTRRFAKRQITWFGKVEQIRWIEIQSENDFNKAALKITKEYRAMFNAVQ
jgi:tRNA dimethylallyltransferase